ncbi:MULTISPECIES: DUF7097 family protein [Haloarcula]|uniref:Uncharacterized protein n=1 Tax=Haloarcula pellucida TaxID=1427151 RepID=A0A830GP92_9EURY|nr:MULTISPECIES: hypothetical protein [Halomicroarcula]MBX0350354.1 hypothetical protein [Halomicroarcula pellucida]MDS0277545.1 hypothetical protein [Halomicroarcula sp. S1AR25-4]QIO22081.1 hypothetical protein G9465_06855 [Haloarcula sp. JP-L23]GGO01658.1 hypothetical protein GCM10009030_35570 [Halomicroarcula pellucida]
MEKAPGGTSVGVDDPYDHVDRCDFVTDEGKCRWAREHGHHDPDFADARSAEAFRCPAAVGPDGETEGAEWDWGDCPHFRCRNRDRECIRCGLEERRLAHSEERPLLEEHHLSYDETREGEDLAHEITVYLCRWCHSKVHNSWARVDDDVNPDPEAIAEKEGRRSKEQSEMGFQSAAERYDDE